MEVFRVVKTKTTEEGETLDGEIIATFVDLSDALNFAFRLSETVSGWTFMVRKDAEA